MLTDVQIKALRPTGQQYRRPDQNGLHIAVAGNGDKSWVFRYKLNGQSGSIGLGSYPEVSLKGARDLRDAARDEVAAGRKPQGLRKQEQAAETGGNNTVAQMIETWLISEPDRWKPSFRPTVERRLRQEVIAPIGGMRASEVTTAVLLERVLEPLRHRSHDLAQRLRQLLEDAFAYGIDKGMLTVNPALMRKKALGTAPRKGHRPALTALPAVRAMLQRVELWDEDALTGAGFPQVKLCHRLIALTAVRPGEEARLAKWDEFDLDAEQPIWTIPEARMKVHGRGEHVVPLSRQAVAVILEAKRRFGHYRERFVFPSVTDGGVAISDSTIGKQLLVHGYRDKHCAHGWRSTFSTIMNDRHPEAQQVISAALAHRLPGVPGIYNRGDHLERRRVLMQEWADLLLEGMAEPAVICMGPRHAPSRAKPVQLRKAA